MIGRAVVAALTAGNEIISASLRSAAIKVDIADPSSIGEMYRRLGKLDAVVCAAGQAKFAPLDQLSDADFRFCLDNKLMGQVSIVRLGLEHVADGGSFTLTTGILAQAPIPGSAAISLVNAGLEGFVRAAALEAPRKIRVNAVSPPWVTETLQALKMDTSQGLPAAVVAQAYVRRSSLPASPASQIPGARLFPDRAVSAARRAEQEISMLVGRSWLADPVKASSLAGAMTLQLDRSQAQVGPVYITCCSYTQHETRHRSPG
jgi:NAD(P)-dependent dehydrogenase (short-subunit alcohol dehydrogenase family)